MASGGVSVQSVFFEGKRRNGEGWGKGQDDGGGDKE